MLRYVSVGGRYYATLALLDRRRPLPRRQLRLLALGASGTSPSGSYAPSCVIKSPVAVGKLSLPGPMGWPSLAKVPT